MDTLEIFGLQLVLSTIVYALIGRWYVVPWLAEKTTNQALMILTLPHAFRHLGMVFLVPGVVDQSIPVFFATSAAYGDLASGLLALLALVALRRAWSGALIIVLLFSLVGIIDLLNALRHADAVPHLGAAWYVPTFVVPILLVTHAMIIARLVALRDLLIPKASDGRIDPA